jgi:hypothetical protein
MINLRQAALRPGSVADSLMLPAVLPVPRRWPVVAVFGRRLQRRCLVVAVLAASLTRCCCWLCYWRPHDGPLLLLPGGGYSVADLLLLSWHNAAWLKVILAGPVTPINPDIGQT